MQETFEHYQKSTGFGNEGRVAAALAKWGPNRFVVPLPRFADMLKEQLVAPFFVFQVFCVGLWCLDDYWCALPCRGCPAYMLPTMALQGFCIGLYCQNDPWLLRCLSSNL